MNWKYFLKVRRLNVKRHFLSRDIKSKKEIINYLNKNNFTFNQDDVDIIYDTIKPEQKKEPAKSKRKPADKPMLSQEKKSVRRRSKKRKKEYVSGSMDPGRKN